MISARSAAIFGGQGVHQGVGELTDDLLPLGFGNIGFHRDVDGQKFVIGIMVEQWPADVVDLAAAGALGCIELARKQRRFELRVLPNIDDRENGNLERKAAMGAVDGDKLRSKHKSCLV